MFTLEGVRVTSLDDLRYGDDYVCSSSAIFHRLPYGRHPSAKVRRTHSDKASDRLSRGGGTGGAGGGLGEGRPPHAPVGASGGAVAPPPLPRIKRTTSYSRTKVGCLTRIVVDLRLSFCCF